MPIRYYYNDSWPVETPIEPPLVQEPEGNLVVTISDELDANAPVYADEEPGPAEPPEMIEMGGIPPALFAVASAALPIAAFEAYRYLRKKKPTTEVGPSTPQSQSQAQDAGPAPLGPSGGGGGGGEASYTDSGPVPASIAVSSGPMSPTETVSAPPPAAVTVVPGTTSQQAIQALSAIPINTQVQVPAGAIIGIPAFTAANTKNATAFIAQMTPTNDVQALRRALQSNQTIAGAQLQLLTRMLTAEEAAQKTRAVQLTMQAAVTSVKATNLAKAGKTAEAQVLAKQAADLNAQAQAALAWKSSFLSRTTNMTIAGWPTGQNVKRFFKQHFHVQGDGAMVPMPAIAANNTFLQDFLKRVKKKDTDAIIALHHLCMLAKEGHPEATFALARLYAARQHAKNGGLTMAAGALPALVMTPLHWATGLLAKVLTTTGNLVAGAGRIAATPFGVAASVVSKL